MSSHLVHLRTTWDLEIFLHCMQRNLMDNGSRNAEETRRDLDYPLGWFLLFIYITVQLMSWLVWQFLSITVANRTFECGAFCTVNQMFGFLWQRLRCSKIAFKLMHSSNQHTWINRVSCVRAFVELECHVAVRLEIRASKNINGHVQKSMDVNLVNRLMTRESATPIWRSLWCTMFSNLCNKIMHYRYRVGNFVPTNDSGECIIKLVILWAILSFVEVYFKMTNKQSSAQLSFRAPSCPLSLLWRVIDYCLRSSLKGPLRPCKSGVALH